MAKFKVGDVLISKDHLKEKYKITGIYGPTYDVLLLDTVYNFSFNVSQEHFESHSMLYPNYIASKTFNKDLMDIIE